MKTKILEYIDKEIAQLKKDMDEVYKITKNTPSMSLSILTGNFLLLEKIKKEIELIEK